MRSEKVDFSITLTSFFMKCTGFWLSSSKFEQQFRDATLYYTVVAILFAVWVLSLDFYHSLGNFSDMAYVACNIIALVMSLYKLFILSLHRAAFMNLITYTQTHFWNRDYDAKSYEILTKCKKQCIFFVCSFTFFAQSTVGCYILTPIIENMGKNKSDRILPFAMWVDLPLTETPYFEITFVIQIFSLYHVGICYLCFDNFLCILNVHTAGQFQMLQQELITICDRYVPSNQIVDWKESVDDLENATIKIYEDVKTCIRRHQNLIEYCKEIEKIFTLIVMGQVLLFSLIICLVGFQVLLADGPPTRRVIFIVHISGTLIQLLMFTFTCNGIIESSYGVVDAAFSSKWYLLPITKAGKMLRSDILMIIMRARRPSCLTAAGFFPISLGTFTTVLSTAMSYFTLMRQGNMKIEGSL